MSSYTSPFLHPQSYIRDVNRFSAEGIAVDEAVARAVRQATADFSNEYSSDWLLVSGHKDNIAQFNETWTRALQQSRDAASSISALCQRFDQAYLAMINDVESQQDAEDLSTELKAFLKEEHPSKNYHLDSTPGPKKVFEEIEGLVTKESEHVVQVLHDEKDWHKSIAELKRNLRNVQRGLQQIRGALNSYATKLA